MPDPFFHFTVRYEIVAEVENLVTLRRQLLIALYFPWGTSFSIVEDEREPEVAG
jgi:hypothetical protein